MSLGLDSVVVAAKSQVSAGLREETVVLGLDMGMYFGLNEVGARIWDLVREPRRVSEIAAAIMMEFDVDSDTCERDVIGFLDTLRSEGLLEIADDP